MVPIRGVRSKMAGPVTLLHRGEPDRWASELRSGHHRGAGDSGGRDRFGITVDFDSRSRPDSNLAGHLSPVWRPRLSAYSVRSEALDFHGHRQARREALRADLGRQGDLPEAHRTAFERKNGHDRADRGRGPSQQSEDPARRWPCVHRNQAASWAPLPPFLSTVLDSPDRLSQTSANRPS